MDAPTYTLHELARATGLSRRQCREIVFSHHVRPISDTRPHRYGPDALAAVRNGRLESEGYTRKIGSRTVETRTR